MRLGLIKILLAVATGILFTFITVFWRGTNEIDADQMLTLHLCKELKRTTDPGLAYIKKNFLLINTIAANPGFDSGEKTDRRQLLTLLRILSRNQQSFRYVALDVLLDKPSAIKVIDDSIRTCLDLLQEQKKILFSGIWSKKKEGFLEQIDAPVVANTGDVSYQPAGDKFFQYKLCLHDTVIKSLPFLMYLKNKEGTLEFNKWGIVQTSDKHGNKVHFFNTFTPELFFDRTDFAEIARTNSDRIAVSGVTSYCDLWSIISNPESGDDTTGKFDQTSRLQELLSYKEMQDKIIFIGDFSGSNNDNHFTTEGTMKGPEILINLLFNLEQGNSRLSWLHLLFLLIGYNLLTFFLYWPIHIHIPQSPNRFNVFLLVAFDIIIIEHLSYILLLLIGVFSYVFFNHIVNVLTLTFYVFVISSIIKGLKKLNLYP